MCDNMINIDGEGIFYGSLIGLYRDGKAGHGLQLSEALEPYRQEIVEWCVKVSDAAYELDALLKHYSKQTTDS